MAKSTDKHAVTDAELTRLVAKHRKDNTDATASGTIKALRAAGASFSGKRVRIMFEGNTVCAKLGRRGEAGAGARAA